MLINAGMVGAQKVVTNPSTNRARRSVTSLMTIAVTSTAKANQPRNKWVKRIASNRMVCRNNWLVLGLGHRRRLFIMSTGHNLRDYIRVTFTIGRKMCLPLLNITQGILCNTLLT